ncbi:MAG: ABC transporter ATP-binding protein/permease [Bacteriovoracaceae bacterium]|nr:ABC transporter ATP-binding protein/permease [Bacteriovoracaceae bacterium]
MTQESVPHFGRFILSLARRRPWSYIGGILSVVILDGVDMLPALIVKHVTDQVQRSPQVINLLAVCSAMIACYLTISILRMAWRLFLMMPSRTLEAELRQEAYEKLLTADYARASRLKVGDVVSTLSQDIANIRMFMGPGVLVLFDSLAYLVFIPTVFFYTLGTSAFFILTPFLILALTIFLIHKPLERGYSAVSDKLGELSQYVFEESSGARFFRSEGLIEVRRKKYEHILKFLIGKQLNIARLELGLDGTLQAVMQLSYLLVLILAFQGYGAMAQSLGTLTISLQLLDKLLWPLMAISYLMNLYQQARAGQKRYHQIDSLPLKKQGSQVVNPKINRIKLEQLCLSTPEGENLLHQISLDIKSGEHIALVGEVGSGKSVLLQCLAGLWEDSSLQYKEFKFDGLNYSEMDRRSLWKTLSYIPQTPQIFSKTLAMNISPHHPLEPGALWAAMEKADLASDVTLFPEGLNTMIGEKGMNLSGGQKQRTLIARSFHSGARIYLWDDAISALDTATERKVIDSLRMLDPGAILILATHRLSSLTQFDKIFVLDNGKITHQGNYAEIKSHHHLFASLLEREIELSKKENPQWNP